jgi:hypothetical protein
MDPLLRERENRGFPGRFAWGAAAIGIIGLLLVSLIVWVERLEATAPDAEPGAPVHRAAPCDIIEPGARVGELPRHGRASWLAS